MEEQLEDVVRKVFNITDDTIDLNWTSEDIKAWDSLGHLNFMMEIEKVYGIKMEIEEMFEVEKIGDIVNIIDKHKN